MRAFGTGPVGEGTPTGTRSRNAGSVPGRPEAVLDELANALLHKRQAQGQSLPDEPRTRDPELRGEPVDAAQLPAGKPDPNRPIERLQVTTGNRHGSLRLVWRKVGVPIGRDVGGIRSGSTLPIPGAPRARSHVGTLQSLESGPGHLLMVYSAALACDCILATQSQPESQAAGQSVVSETTVLAGPIALSAWVARCVWRRTVCRERPHENLRFSAPMGVPLSHPLGGSRPADFSPAGEGARAPLACRHGERKSGRRWPPPLHSLRAGPVPGSTWLIRRSAAKTDSAAGSSASWSRAFRRHWFWFIPPRSLLQHASGVSTTSTASVRRSPFRGASSSSPSCASAFCSTSGSARAQCRAHEVALSGPPPPVAETACHEVRQSLSRAGELCLEEASDLGLKLIDQRQPQRVVGVPSLGAACGG